MRRVIIGSILTVLVLGGLLFVERQVRLSRGIPNKASQEGKVLPSELELKTFPEQQSTNLGKVTNGKVALINFWASWCEACMAEMPSIQSLYDKLKGEGFQVIAVNVDENPAAVVPRIVDRLKLTFPVFTEVDENLSSAFNVVAIPFSIIVDREGKVAWSESGERDWASEKVVGEIKGMLQKK